MPKKAKRDKKTGRYVSNDNSSEAASRRNASTPFAPGGNGIPGGWTPIADKPSKAKAPKLPKVIRVEHRIEKGGYLANVRAIADMAKRIKKDGAMPIIHPR